MDQQEEPCTVTAVILAIGKAGLGLLGCKSLGWLMS